MPKDLTYIAQTNFRGADQKFGIRRTDRRQHMYVIGKTGVGKTQFLKNMALQDVENGEGLAIIDPHGEFVEEVLESIPRHRMQDVVYFNPADMEFPVSFNIMDVKDPKYKHLIASGLIGIFTKIWANVWSARMEYILANCILALLDTPGTTLLGIPRMLVDRDYRQKIINNLQDPVVKSFWINEYEEWESRYRNEAIAPVQNKVGQFLNVSFVRNIVGQAKNTIDIEEIMNTGKILLVNVSKGRIGEDNAAILGAMIITKIQLSAMERVRIPENDRRDFYLYVDEFQNFATDSFRNILSEARKYRLNLIMAHQYIGQLVTENNTAVRDAVFGNVGTEISFRVGAEDAEFLEKEFTPEFLQDDFVRLANRDIYLKLMIGGLTSRPFSAKTITVAPIAKDDKKRDEMVKLSRAKYARNKKTVEDDINRWAANLEVAGASTNAAAPVQWQNTPKQAVSHIQADGTKLYDAVCSNCGKKTKVIFEPTSGKPVYCKSCLKKMKPDKSSAGSEHFDGPATILAKPNLGVAESGDSALADLGIEFGPSKPNKKNEKNNPVIRPGVTSPNVAKPQIVESSKIENIEFKKVNRHENQRQEKPQKKEINLSELRKALEESLKKNEDEDNETENLPEVKVEKVEETKLPEINKNEASEEKPDKSPAGHFDGPVTISSKANLVVEEKELEVKLAKLLEGPKPEQEETAITVIPEKLEITKEIAKEINFPEIVKSLEEPIKQNPEEKPDKSPVTTGQFDGPAIIPPQADLGGAYDPDEELQKRIAQEKMSDEVQKNLAIDFSEEPKKQKGVINPGQKIKF